MAAPGTPRRTLVDGRAAAEVSVLERGLHYGDGVFETIACVAGVPRLLDLHLARLVRGTERLRIAPVDIGGIGREIRELAAEADRSVVKLIVTRGTASARGYAAGAARPTRILLAYDWPEQAAAAEGINVRMADLKLAENPALAGIKHLNRLEQVLARGEWDDPDIAESLMLSRGGRVISGTMSNVFIVRGGQLLTPSVDACGVAGVMRELVLMRAGAAGITAREGTITPDDLMQAEEIFLTNALTGIRAVAWLAGRDFAAGPVTLRLVAAIAPALAGHPAPAGAP